MNSLKFLLNKRDFLTENAYTIRKGLVNIIDSVEKDGFYYTIDIYGFFMRINLPNASCRQVFEHEYGINRNAVTHRVFDDKIITAKILEQNSILTPKSFLLIKENTKYSDFRNNKTACIKFCENIGFPIIIKPIDGSQGRGVKKLIDKEQLIQELDNINNGIVKGVNFVVQEYVGGQDVRVIYLDGKIELAYERIPATVIGNGVDDLQKLIYVKYNNRKIEIDQEIIIQFLSNQGLNLSYIPYDGEKIQFVPTANVSTGGDVLRFDFDKEDEDFIKRIAKIFGARYFGIDILTNNKISDGCVLEINKMPGTTGADIVEPGFGKKLGAKIWQIIKKDEGII